MFYMKFKCLGVNGKLKVSTGHLNHLQITNTVYLKNTWLKKNTTYVIT